MSDLRSQAFNLKDEGRIYLDHNATTPLATELLPYIQNTLKHWGNPSSIHQHGRGPKAVIRNGRTSIAAMVGCSSLEIIFTSGGSEGNNQVLKGIVLNPATFPQRNKLIISAVEHPSVTKTAEYLRDQHAVELVTVPVNRDGILDMQFLQTQLDEKTSLVSVMAANNETGHLFPIRKIAKLAHDKGALFHTDAVQALGKMVVNLKEWDVDFATFSAHKFYSLKGCGFIYQKKGHTLPSLIHGGAQERRRRAGTENSLAIGCLGQMALHKDEVQMQFERLRELRDWFEAEVQEQIPGVSINGAGSPRLPSTSSMLIEGVDGETLLMNLDIEGFSVSTGAACSSGSPEPSPVLLAMGLSRQEAQSSLRVGIGWGTQKEELQKFVEALDKIVRRIRGFSHPEASHG